MTLQDAIERYIAWRRAHGAKFVASARLLHCFCKQVGGTLHCDAVGEAQVLSYLVGNGPLTRYRANKYGALAGFWRYAISRGCPSSNSPRRASARPARQLLRRDSMAARHLIDPRSRNETLRDHPRLVAIRPPPTTPPTSPIPTPRCIHPSALPKKNLLNIPTSSPPR